MTAYDAILLIVHNEVEIRKKYDVRNLCGFETEWKIIMTSAVSTQRQGEEQEGGKSRRSFCTLSYP
jgi:hypothetical protein